MNSHRLSEKSISATVIIIIVIIFIQLVAQYMQVCDFSNNRGSGVADDSDHC